MTDIAGRLVRTATSQDRARVVDVLTAAFQDDPVFRHLLPPTVRRRPARLRLAFRLEVARSQRHGGTLITEDGAGVLVCFPPGRWEATAWENICDAAQWRYVFGRHLGTAASAISRMEKEQRKLPDHLFLCYGAVDPARQGLGLGTMLLESVLERCDTTRTPAYLEASNGVSHALAARYGFVDLSPFSLSQGGPTILPMWRDPA